VLLHRCGNYCGIYRTKERIIVRFWLKANAIIEVLKTCGFKYSSATGDWWVPIATYAIDPLLRELARHNWSEVYAKSGESDADCWWDDFDYSEGVALAVVKANGNAREAIIFREHHDKNKITVWFSAAPISIVKDALTKSAFKRDGSRFSSRNDMHAWDRVSDAMTILHNLNCRQL